MGTNSFTQEVSKQAGWSIFMGVLTAAIGIVMIIYPAATATFSTLFVGWMLIFAAIAQIAFAFTSDSAGNFFLLLLFGIVYGIGGIALLAYPVTGAVTLTAALGVMLIIEGILETAVAFELPAGTGRGWFVVSAISSGLLGILILAKWPASTGWAIGTLVGAAVLMNGITRVVVSTAVRSGAKKVDQLAHA